MTTLKYKKAWIKVLKEEIKRIEVQLKDWNKRVSETKKKFGYATNVQLAAIEKRKKHVVKLKGEIKNIQKIYH